MGEGVGGEVKLLQFLNYLFTSSNLFTALMLLDSQTLVPLYYITLYTSRQEVINPCPAE